LIYGVDAAVGAAASRMKLSTLLSLFREPAGNASKTGHPIFTFARSPGGVFAASLARPLVAVAAFGADSSRISAQQSGPSPLPSRTAKSGA